MEFSSLFFLYVFLPLTAAVYFLMPGIRRKNIVLIAASLLFYAVGQPVYLLLLLGLGQPLRIRHRPRISLRNRIHMPTLIWVQFRMLII